MLYLAVAIAIEKQQQKLYHVYYQLTLSLV